MEGKHPEWNKEKYPKSCKDCVDDDCGGGPDRPAYEITSYISECIFIHDDQMYTSKTCFAFRTENKP